MQRIVLAYSGGLHTSVAIPWLAEKHGAEIVAVTMDLGRGTGLEDVRDRALAAGAVRAHVLDVREEFARDYVLPALHADAVYEDRRPLGRALARAVSLQYADIVHNGLWFTPLREALDAYVAKVQERVSGVIRLKLFKGDCRVVGRKSSVALYDKALPTRDAGDVSDHVAAVGFIKIVGPPGETAARKA